MVNRNLDIVIGAKTFARDLRASDIKVHPDYSGADWGKKTLRAMYLRARQFGSFVVQLGAEEISKFGAINCYVKPTMLVDRTRYWKTLSGTERVSE